MDTQPLPASFMHVASSRKSSEESGETNPLISQDFSRVLSETLQALEESVCIPPTPGRRSITSSIDALSFQDLEMAKVRGLCAGLWNVCLRFHFWFVGYSCPQTLWKLKFRNSCKLMESTSNQCLLPQVAMNACDQKNALKPIPSTRKHDHDQPLLVCFRRYASPKCFYSFLSVASSLIVNSHTQWDLLCIPHFSLIKARCCSESQVMSAAKPLEPVVLWHCVSKVQR